MKTNWPALFMLVSLVIAVSGCTQAPAGPFGPGENQTGTNGETPAPEGASDLPQNALIRLHNLTIAGNGLNCRADIVYLIDLDYYASIREKLPSKSFFWEMITTPTIDLRGYNGFIKVLDAYECEGSWGRFDGVHENVVYSSCSVWMRCNLTLGDSYSGVKVKMEHMNKETENMLTAEEAFSGTVESMA